MNLSDPKPWKGNFRTRLGSRQRPKQVNKLQIIGGSGGINLVGTDEDIPVFCVGMDLPNAIELITSSLGSIPFPELKNHPKLIKICKIIAEMEKEDG